MTHFMLLRRLLLPRRLTPYHSHHSRTGDLQQRSPERSYCHCGCTACQIWLQLPQRPVRMYKNKSFFFIFFLPLSRKTKNSHLGLFVGPPHPAGPTRSLISDLLDCGAVGPFLAGVKAVWKLYSFSIMEPEPENADKRYLTLTHHCCFWWTASK